MPRDYLVELRTKQNETQQDVATAIGISRQYYAMIESGERQKRMDMMLITALSSHFNLSINDFVVREQCWAQDGEDG